jgi:hypothetical protein
MSLEKPIKPVGRAARRQVSTFDCVTVDALCTHPSPLFFWHHGTEAYDGFAFRVGNGDQSQRCHSTVRNGSTATQIVIVVIAYLAAAA